MWPFKKKNTQRGKGLPKREIPQREKDPNQVKVANELVEKIIANMDQFPTNWKPVMRISRFEYCLSVTNGKIIIKEGSWTIGTEDGGWILINELAATKLQKRIQIYIDEYHRTQAEEARCKDTNALKELMKFV